MLPMNNLKRQLGEHSTCNSFYKHKDMYAENNKIIFKISYRRFKLMGRYPHAWV